MEEGRGRIRGLTHERNALLSSLPSLNDPSPSAAAPTWMVQGIDHQNSVHFSQVPLVSRKIMIETVAHCLHDNTG